jgi:predicted DNA-binding protein (MmcQ/YjbR family)
MPPRCAPGACNSRERSRTSRSAPSTRCSRWPARCSRSARSTARPLEVSVKCEPELAVGLRDSYPAIRPGYHLNKRHWNTLTLDGSLSDQLVRDLIEDSYDLIVSALPQRVRAQLS